MPFPTSNSSGLPYATRRRKEAPAWSGGWNLTFSLVVPFDTEEQARAALDDLDWDRFGDLAHELFGGCREVMSAGIEEDLQED